MNDLEEALRSELRDRAEAADREVNLLEPVACRVRQARRRCALAASALTTIVGLGVTASVPAWTILRSAQGTATLGNGSLVTKHSPAAMYQLAVKAKPGIVAGLLNLTEQAVVHLPPVSLQAVLLAQERYRAVPVGWRWHEFGGIRFAAPASWNLEREGSWVSCRYGVAPRTVLLTNAALRSAFGCGKLPAVAAGELALVPEGIVVGTGRYTASEIRSGPTGPCLRLGNLRVCVIQPGNDTQFKVAVYPPGSASPALVEIGLARSPATARTIFDSIRQAPSSEAMMNGAAMNSRMNVTSIRAN